MIKKSFMVRVGADTKDMERGLKSAEARMKKFNEQCTKIGKGMTIAGAAIIGALTMITKKASDAQETFSKFGTVFQDSITEAEGAANELTKSYGLSMLAAKDMLSATGDLLTGLGLQGKAALSLSRRTQKLSVDLASFTNYAGGAKGASEALTKAMLGERESVKALGIVITEEMVKEELLKKGKEDLTGMALLQAKAEATLAIAITQSKNAIGDYERTSGDLANVVRRLVARLENLWVTIGTKLIPVTTEYAKKITKIVEETVEWIDVHPKLTSVLAKGAAALGGTLFTLGGIGMVLPKVTDGFRMLAIAAKTALGAFGVGAILAVGLYKVFEKLKLGPLFNPEILDDQTEAYNRQRAAIGLWSDFADKAVRAQIAGREDLIAIWNKYEQNTLEAYAAIARGDEGERLRLFFAELIKGEKIFMSWATGIGMIFQAISTRIGETAEATQKTGPVFTLWATTVAKIFHDTSVRAAEMWRAMRDIELIIPPAAITMPKFTLETEIGTEEFETFGAWYKAWVEGLKEKWKTAWQAALEGSREVLGALNSVFSQFHENEATRLDNEEKKRTDAIESWYEAKKAKIEATVMDEEAKVAALEALDEEKARKENELQHRMDKERRKLERKRAKAQKVGAIFAAGINIAEAITKALAQGGFLLGAIFSGIVAALGAIQVAAIAAAPLPSLAKGGMIEREGIYRLHPGEEVRSAADVRALGSPAMAVRPGISTFSPTINIYARTLDDRTINQATEKIFRRLDFENRRYGRR